MRAAILFSIMVIASGGLVTALQDSAIDRMVQRLSDNDPEIRKQAVRDLTKVGKDAVPALEKVLKDGDLDTQILAKGILNKIEWELGIDSIRKYLADRSPIKDVKIEMIGTRALTAWLPNVRLVETIMKLPVAEGEPTSDHVDRNVFAIERYGTGFSKIFAGGIYSPSSLAGVLKGYKVVTHDQAMDLAGIISEITLAITGEKTSGARLENKEGTWKIFVQDGETISLKTDEKGLLIDIVSSSGDTQELSEKERLEIEKLKLDIQVQKKVLENLEKQDQKKEPKADPKLPQLLILAYTGGGIAGKTDEAMITDGHLKRQGRGNEGAPIYNIPEEDKEELLKLSAALLAVNPKRVYGERHLDVEFSNYTVSLIGKREATVTWYKDGVEVPAELKKFEAKYQEIYQRSRPIK